MKRIVEYLRRDIRFLVGTLAVSAVCVCHLIWSPAATVRAAVDPESRYAAVVGDGKTDCTTAIQKLLDEPARRAVSLPAGDYLVSTLTVNRHLILEPGAVLIQKPESSATMPLVRINNREATLTGGGKLLATKPTPLGVLAIGPEEGKSRKIVFSTVRGISIYGVAGNDQVESIGINMTSSEPGSGGATYASVVSECLIVGTDIGIRLGGVVNGHIIFAPRFYLIGKVCIDSLDNTENTIIGGFVHQSYDVTQLRFRNCGYNQVYGFQGEPGGKAIPVTVDKDCKACAIWMHDNCVGEPVLEGQSTIFSTHGEITARKFVETGK